MRHALVKDGKVVNIIVADRGYKPPDDHRSIPISDTDKIDIGYGHDGSSFKPPAINPVHLTAHGYRRYLEANYTTHRLRNGDTVVVEAADRDVIARLAVIAKRKADFAIDWPMPFGKNARVVKLTAKDIIAVNDQIDAFNIARLRTLAGVIEGVKDGTVTNHVEVDEPPPPIPPWPPRFDEELR